MCIRVGAVSESTDQAWHGASRLNLGTWTTSREPPVYWRMVSNLFRLVMLVFRWVKEGSAQGTRHRVELAEMPQHFGICHCRHGYRLYGSSWLPTTGCMLVFLFEHNRKLSPQPPTPSLSYSGVWKLQLMVCFLFHLAKKVWPVFAFGKKYYQQNLANCLLVSAAVFEYHE